MMIGQVIGNIQQNEWKPQPFWRFEPFPVFLYQLGSSSENGEKEHISGLNWKELELDAITKSIQI